MDAYRGAGRPEAAYLIERLVDIYARKIGMDPVEVRRKNFIPQGQVPLHRRHRAHLRLGQLRARARQGAPDPRLPGLPPAAGGGAQGGPLPRRRRRLATSRSAASARRRWPARSASAAGCTTRPSSGCTPRAWSGSTSAPARTARARRPRSPRSSPRSSAYPIENVEIVHGDTETTPQGWGTYGSRTTAVCGSAVKVAAPAGQGEGEEDRRPPDGGQRAGRRVEGRRLPGARLAGPGQELRRGGAHGQPRVEHAGRRRAGARGVGVLRPDATSSIPSAATSAPSRWTSRPAR